MQHKKSFSVLPCILLGIIILFGCSAGAEQRSTLNINIQTATAKTIVPEDVSLDVTKYVITGTGPGGNEFTTTTNKTSVSISGLLIGEWDLHVVGQNSSGTNLVEGSATVTLNPSPTPVEIQLSTLKGTGAINLTVTWDPALILEATFSLTLTDPEGVTTTPTLDTTNISSGSISFSGTSYAAGSYKAIGQLFSGDHVVAGFAEAIRVVDGLSSTATIALNLDKTTQIPATITLVNNVGTPVQCSIDGLSSEMPVGVETTATISTTETQELNITWYLDGREVATGLSYTFTPTIGEHRIDVIASGAKQASTGSATIGFTGKVIGEAGVPVFMAQISDGNDNIYLSGETKSAFLPDGKLLIASEGHQTVQICQFVGNDLQPVTTYNANNSDFPCSRISDIAVDTTRNLVFIADNTGKKVTKYSYNSADATLVKVLESDNLVWASGSNHEEYNEIGNLALDETCGKLYATAKGSGTLVAVVYNEEATTQASFRETCVEADFTVQPKTSSKGTYKPNNFDSIVISPDDKYFAGIITSANAVFTSPKNDGYLGLSFNACSNQSDDITGFEGLSTVAFLSDNAMVAGTGDKLVVVGGELSSYTNIPWENLTTYSSGGGDVGGKTIGNVVQMEQNTARDKLYVLCSGSRNLLTFSTSGNSLTYEEEAATGDFVPFRFSLSPDGTLLFVTSNSSAAAKIYRIPQ